ncbi:putative lyase (fragment) [Bacillus subtilis]
MHHIELYVSDLETSGRFWGWFLTELGYKEYQKGRTGLR